MISELIRVIKAMRGLPDLIAFWLDSWVIRVEDHHRLSPAVFDAWWWR
jgi:hypothetical protein